MSNNPLEFSDVEVDITRPEGKAVIEGKTGVPFKAFVGLVLQRKLRGIYEKWSDDKVIVTSDLLTELASAPSESHENTNHLVLVSLGVGVVFGVFAFAVFQMLLLFFEVTMGRKELFFIAAGLFGVAVVVAILMKIQRRKKGQKLVQLLESIAAFLKK